MVPQLIKKLEDVQIEIEQLKVTNPKTESMIPSDSTLDEFEERQKKAKNVMTCNLPESRNNVIIIIFKETTTDYALYADNYSCWQNQ